MPSFGRTGTEFSLPAIEMLETLREEDGLVLYRGVGEVDRSTVLVLTPVAEQSPPGSLQRLEQEYAYREELDSGWAVRPLAFFPDNGRPTLVLADPGGELLSRLVGQAWPIAQFL